MDLGGIIYTAVELVGIIAFAVSGAMTGIKRGLDMIGVIIVGAVTALGGGVARDILLGSIPPMMFRNYKYLIAALISSLAVFAAAYFFKDVYKRSEHRIDRVNNIFDALGLGLFTVVGVSTAMEAGYDVNAFFCIFLGVITGVGGGIMRDIMTRATPTVLKKHVYAIASVAGACVYYYFCKAGLHDTAAMLAASASVFVIRMLATHFKWNLPKA